MRSLAVVGSPKKKPTATVCTALRFSDVRWVVHGFAVQMWTRPGSVPCPNCSAKPDGKTTQVAGLTSMAIPVEYDLADALVVHPRIAQLACDCPTTDTLL